VTRHPYFVAVVDGIVIRVGRRAEPGTRHADEAVQDLLRVLPGEPAARTVAVMADPQDVPSEGAFVVVDGEGVATLGGTDPHLSALCRALLCARPSQEAAEAAPGGVIIHEYAELNWCSVIFAEQPDRSILDALRYAGYSWGSGSWVGYLDRLPATVREYAQA